MAKAAKNIVLVGISGTIGGQLTARQWRGQTILAQPPGARTKAPTEAQRAHQQKFQQATVYGKAALKDPAVKAEYAEKGGNLRSAYNVAVADFLHAPDVDEIDVSNYLGAVNDPIRVRVTDDFKVVQVQVTIHNADGSTVEKGNAVQQANEIDWVYTATVANESLEGDKIVIRASDRPGNITEDESVL